jgi:biopolymer transport protein ExbD
VRRFSQRNSLVTLSEINITPLLDLAFVLLIIFIITTPLLEQSVKLNLPGGGQEAATKPRKEDLATVEITRDGEYVFHRKSIALHDLERELVLEFKQNPKLGVVIRADNGSPWGKGVAITDICEKHGIQKVGIATKSDK